MHRIYTGVKHGPVKSRTRSTLLVCLSQLLLEKSRPLLLMHEKIHITRLLLHLLIIVVLVVVLVPPCDAQFLVPSFETSTVLSCTAVNGISSSSYFRRLLLLRPVSQSLRLLCLPSLPCLVLSLCVCGGGSSSSIASWPCEP